MRPTRYFTSTHLYYDSPRHVAVGDFIRSNGESVYLVDHIRRSPTKRFRKYLNVLRFDPKQVPADAVAHPLF